MFIYNVTCNVAPQIVEEWLHWMKNTHIPEVMSTKCFKESKILRLIGVEDEGSTFAIQYIYENEEDIVHYQSQFAPSLQAKTKEKYGEAILAFRTYMEIIHP
jgi:hypothetical protein